MFSNLSELARRFRVENADIVKLDEHVAHSGEYTDFFYAYCLLGEELYSLNDRHPVLPRYQVDLPKFIDSHIFLNRYAPKGSGWELVERIDLDPTLNLGWDPRVVSNGRNAYGIIIANTRTVGHETLLYDFRRRRLIPIQVEDSNFIHGKNWQPFLVGDELFVVHELVPFRVLRVDTRDGAAHVVREVDVSFKLPAFHGSYPMFRGGCNAVWQGGSIFGLGRATSQSFRHHPFFWCMMEDDHIQVLFTEFFSAFQDRGFNIIDPTSMFVIGNDLFVGLACSETDWAHPQLLSHFLLRFSTQISTRREGNLAEFLINRPKTQERGVPKLSRHTFFCIEMPSAIESVHEIGGRLSRGTAGHLVHGPYVRIEGEGRYCAELTYITKSSPGSCAGVFDVVASRANGMGGQIEFVPLGHVELAATHGELGKARLEFDTTGLRDHLLELRVYVERAVEMNAFHIRTWLTPAGDRPPDLGVVTRDDVAEGVTERLLIEETAADG